MLHVECLRVRGSACSMCIPPALQRSENLPNPAMPHAAILQTTPCLSAAGSLPQGARAAQPGLPQLPPHLLGQLQQLPSGQQPALQQFLAMQMARQQVSWTELFT